MSQQPPNEHPPASYTQYPRLQRFAAGAYAVFLVVVSLLPGKSLPKILDWNLLFSPDKIAHFGAYAIFAVLLYFSLQGLSHWTKTATAVGAAAAFGALMEVLQGVAGTGRDFDYVDMVANLLGALIGALFLYPLTIIVKKYFAPVAE